jgi:hypothetical protein
MIVTILIKYFQKIRRYNVTKSLKYILLSALALAVVLGCNFSSGGTENGNISINENSGDGNSDPAPSLPFTITNNSSRTMCALYVSLEEATVWGEERLGTEVLDIGESYGLDLPDGNYRVRASDCDNNLIAEYDDFEVAGSTTLRVEDKTVDNTLVVAGDPGTLTVINNSSEDVCYVFVSSTEATSWGDDWLDDTTILDNGESETLVVGAGLYDLQAADCDGSGIAEQYDVDLSTGQTWTLGQ